MASNVVVIDSAARRHTVKTTPNKYLSDVLSEACAKLGYDANQYGLKHNNKQVDLSRTIRLSGLSAGAKLNLVQASRSPAVVSVALQLPQTDSPTGTSARLTDKFPSNTTIWQILRRFESGVAGEGASTGSSLNFTQRATPQLTDGGQSGSGRLCYEMPVVNALGRELATFADLTKTLVSLGVNSGSCMLRLSYRTTQQPLEEAMLDITRYFQAVEEPKQTASDSHGAHAAAPGELQSTPATEQPEELQSTPAAEEPVSQSPAMPEKEDVAPDTPMPDANEETAAGSTDSSAPTSAPSPQTNGSASDPTISIFAPPTSSTPAAAGRDNFDESDYIPTVDHAKQHQALLATAARNRRLLSTAELEAQQNSRAAALSLVAEVVVRVRFPDQSQAQRTFGQDATAADVYAFCRALMHRPRGEGFSVRVAGEGAKSAPVAVPDDAARKLIRDLGWQGRVLVTVAWADDVGAATRRGPVLKEEYRARAQQLQVKMPAPEEQPGGAEGGAGSAPQTGQPAPAPTGGQDKETKMRRFLKGLSKK